MVAIWWALTPTFKEPRDHPNKKKRTFEPAVALEDTAFKPGFEILKL